MFNKGDGKYIQTRRQRIPIAGENGSARDSELALKELAEFFPSVAAARVDRFHVVKELRATYSAQPGL